MIAASSPTIAASRADHRVVAGSDCLIVLAVGDIPFRNRLIALELRRFAQGDVLVAIA